MRGAAEEARRSGEDTGRRRDGAERTRKRGGIEQGLDRSQFRWSGEMERRWDGEEGGRSGVGTELKGTETRLNCTEPIEATIARGSRGKTERTRDGAEARSARTGPLQ